MIWGDIIQCMEYGIDGDPEMRYNNGLNNGKKGSRYV